MRKIKNQNRKQTGRVRTMVVVMPLLLLLGIGLVMVYDASVVEAQEMFGDKYYFVRGQAIWVGLGLGLAFLVSRWPIKWWTKIAAGLFGASLILLAAVLVPGIGGITHGAQRWIRLGNFSFQPSELVKLTSVLYLSSWLKSDVKIGHYLVLMGILFGLLILQPDLGTATIIVTTSFLMLFVSGARLRSVLGLGLSGAFLVLVMALISPYRANRLKTFINPTTDSLGSSYHINQILISLGSGGWWGLGLGRSRQKFQYLPEATTDSIFAVVGEELGFIGTLTVIALFMILFGGLFRVALREADGINKLLGVGLTGWLTIQTLVNLAGMVALLPLTGVPLPFISYGRSSLMAQMASVGILWRISLSQK